MKAKLFLIFCLLAGSIFAQESNEIEIETKVSEVTVFIEGAQITRTKTINFAAGKSVLKFSHLSPFVDAKSIQVKAQGNITVLSVNHQQNFLQELEKSEVLTNLETEIKAIDLKIELERTQLSILEAELDFLNENRVIGGKNNELSIANLKEASDFYGTQLSRLMLAKIERNKTLALLREQKFKLVNQQYTLSGKKEFAMGEVLVKVEAKTNTQAFLELSYLVKNAGWHPSYDIRAKSINEPLEIIYKANVRQDTKTDWNQVKLKFSSSNPSSSGVAPELKTYYLDYNNHPPVYNATINSVSGQVVDQDNQPLPGATIMVRETTIGTVTDMNGNYSITIPTNSDYLDVSFIGFKTQTLPIKSSIINVKLEEDRVALDEVVVTGYGVQSDYNMEQAVPSMAIRGVSTMNRKKTESIAIPFENTENQTSVEFEIQMPYTVKSDNKSYAVDMAVYQVEADYQYYSIPKISSDAFLMANITNWEQYNLLEGEANLFFEDTYMGKSLIDVRYASDTLQLSLGKDKNVSVSRKSLKDFASRQFMGSKKEETKFWQTTVRNNKNQAINMVIIDQVPVSKSEDIEVDVETLSGGNRNKDNGEIKWEFTLKPMDEKKFDLKYSVKYPKSKSLVIQ